MEDIDYGAIFGIDEGANEQDVAAPAETEDTQGANEQEVATPAEVTDTTTQTKDQQTPDENAKYAAARRQAEAERDAAIARANENAKKTLDEFIRDSGLVNPYTGQKIQNKAEYDAYKQQFDKDRTDKILNQTGMSQEEFDAYVKSRPEMRAAMEAQQRAEAAEKAARETKAQADIEKWISEIHAMDPSINKLEDITKADNYDSIYGYVKKGLSLTEAYTLANHQRLVSAQTAAAKQTALNQNAGKAHMTGIAPKGTGAAAIPKSEMELMKYLMPDVKTSEFEAAYQKYHQKE